MPEVAEGFDCTQRTIYNRLDSPVSDGLPRKGRNSCTRQRRSTNYFQFRVTHRGVEDGGMTADRAQRKEGMLNVDTSSTTGNLNSSSEMFGTLSRRPECRVRSQPRYEDESVAFESLTVVATDPLSEADGEDSRDTDGRRS